MEMKDKDDWGIRWVTEEMSSTVSHVKPSHTDEVGVPCSRGHEYPSSRGKIEEEEETTHVSIFLANTI